MKPEDNRSRISWKEGIFQQHVFKPLNFYVMLQSDKSMEEKSSKAF